MNAEQLRALQAPLKDRYRADASAARYTLTARGELDVENLTCTLDSVRTTAVAGLHPAAGGDGRSLCSGDMLLESLVACAGVTLTAVAMALGLKLRGGTVVAEGDLDFRGTLGLNKEVPVGFEAIRLQFELEGELTQDQVDNLLRLTERYCVILQTLKHPPSIAASASTTPR